MAREAKKINIRQIAELSGCSPSTVSRVLSCKDTDIKISEETREKIHSVCRELEYMPSIHASRFFSKTSRIVGFLPARDTFIEDDNLARSMDGAYYALNKAGYRCMPLLYDERFIEDKEYLNVFRRKEVDALIIWGAEDSYSWLDELAEEKLPFILLANRFKEYPYFSCDNRFAIAELVRHCRLKGAENFAYVSICNVDSCNLRKEGYLGAVPGSSERLDIIEGGMSIDDGYRAGERILQMKPDAVICGNDRLALGVEKRLLEAGLRIPQDILLTGGDNIELSEHCRVPLTTFDQMAKDCAIKGVNALLEHLKNGTEIKSSLISPRHIFCDSA